MNLQYFAPVFLVLFGITPFFAFDFLYAKKKEVPKLIYYSIKKCFDNPFYGDETEIALYDADIGEINKYSFEESDENCNNYKKISKYLEGLKKKHKLIVLVTCDHGDLHLDLVFKYALKKYMSFDNDNFIFMNIKTLYYYAFINIDYASFDDDDYEDNSIPLIKYPQLFQSLCNDIGYDPSNEDDILALRDTI